MDIANSNIFEILTRSTRINQIIRSIDSFKEENLFLTGGSLRNVVWNSLHSYNENYELEDCDIIFYNQTNNSKEYENFIKQQLYYISPAMKWSVKNQARMHIKNRHKPYKNISDALSTSPETCSAIAIDKNWQIISPYGVNDLLKLLIKPTKFCEENEINVFYNRSKRKDWISKWSNLTF